MRRERDPEDRFKRAAAEAAVEFVESGMVVGLGTGSTAAYAVRRIAQRLRDGSLKNLTGIPTSRRTEAQARRLGIPISNLDDHPSIDLTIDGADEVDPELNLLKGGGGALLREKIVAQATRREIIVVDWEKPSPVLGTRCALPVEVVSFGCGSYVRYLESLGARVKLRRTARGVPFRSDQGHWIVDCAFGPIADPQRLAEQILARAGIVEHGLFLGLTTDLIIAGPEGIEHVKRER